MKNYYLGFRRIIQPLFKAVDAKDKKFRTMNRFKLRNLVVQKSIEIRDRITSLASRKMVSLKVDGATRNLRSFVGVNVQFFCENSLKIFTLGVVEMLESHTSTNLKKKIIDVLNNFKISQDQIYSITTDNANNYTCCA